MKKRLALTVKTKMETKELSFLGRKFGKKRTYEEKVEDSDTYQLEELDQEEDLEPSKKVISWIPIGTEVNYDDFNILLSRDGYEDDDEWFYNLASTNKSRITNKFLAAKEIEKHGITVNYPTEITSKESTIDLTLCISFPFLVNQSFSLEMNGSLRGIDAITFLIQDISFPRDILDLSKDEDRETITLEIVKEIKKTYQEVPEVKAGFQIKEISLEGSDDELIGEDKDLEKLKNRINGILHWLWKELDNK